MPDASRARAGIVAVANLVALISVALTGCSQLEPTPPTQPVTDPSQLYVRLELNHRAINLASDTTVPAANTLQLTVTPYNGTGAVIAGAPAPVFTSSDSTAVVVTPDGRLQGRRAGNGIVIAATLTIGAVRRSDTAVVNVFDVAPVPVLQAFSIHVPPEGAVWYTDAGAGGLVTVLAPTLGLIPSSTLASQAADADGNPLQGLAVEYLSLDTTVARVDRHEGAVTLLTSGYVDVVARTVAFGVAKADTMTYTVQPAFGPSVVIDQKGFYTFGDATQIYAPSVTMVAGGIVQFVSITRAFNDVTFDDPADVAVPPDVFCNVLTGLPQAPYCGAGNIAAFNGDSATTVGSDGGAPWRFRQFPVPGTYPFHSTTTGATGRIIVVAPTPPP